MRKILILLICTGMVMLCLGGCGEPAADIAATTLPVYEFTNMLCEGTPLGVTRLVTEEVSCLHDYTLNVRQARAAESARVIVISGAGLEDFLDDLIKNQTLIDASRGISLLCPGEAHAHDHGHEDHGHNQENDPHIWLDPENAMVMAGNICDGLCRQFPEYESTFRENLTALMKKLDAVKDYGSQVLSQLSCREMITFHDGFSYFAQAFDLTILRAIEEESGSEASAKELIELIEETRHHNLPAIFTEKSGSVSAAGVISRETGAAVYALDMAMAGDSYFDAMYRNIDTVKEAMG